MDGNKEDFLQRFVSASNPFLSTRVRNIWEFIYDTRDVHKKAFEDLLLEYEEVRKSGQSRGVTVWGSPGVGKSHLLNRFRRAIHEKGLSLVFQVRPLQGEAGGWFSHILNSIVSELFMDTGDGLTHRHDQIVHLLQMLIPNISEYSSEGNLSEEDLRAIKNEYRHTRDFVLGHIDHPIVVEAFKVFVHFLFDQFMLTHIDINPNVKKRLKERILCGLKWLKGLQLDTDARQTLGVNQNLGSELIYDPSDAGFFAVLKLLGVVTNGHYPLVLVIDQIETVSDITAEHFSRQIHTLLDESSNFLVITCGVSEKIADFVDRKVFQEAAFDRLAERKIHLEPPAERHYADIVYDRVSHIVQPGDKSAHPRLERKPCIFPFTVEMLGGMLNREDVAPTPRQLLTGLRDLFEVCQRECHDAGWIWLENWPEVPPVKTLPKSIPPPVSSEISRHIETELARMKGIISNNTMVGELAASDQELRGIVQEIMALLASDESRNHSVPRLRKSGEVPGCKSRAVDMALESSTRLREELNADSIGLIFDSRGDGRAVFHSFKRLEGHFTERLPDPAHVFFVRDGRSHFSNAWNRTCEIRKELEHKKVLTYIELNKKDVTDVLALGAIFQAIKGRDLVIEQGILSAYTVTLTDLGLFLRSAQIVPKHPLMASLFRPWPPRKALEPQELNTIVLGVMKSEKLMNIEQLAEMCSATSSVPGNRESFLKEFEAVLEDLSQRGDLIVGTRIVRYPM